MRWQLRSLKRSARFCSDLWCANFAWPVWILAVKWDSFRSRSHWEVDGCKKFGKGFLRVEHPRGCSNKSASFLINLDCLLNFQTWNPGFGFRFSSSLAQRIKRFSFLQTAQTQPFADNTLDRVCKFLPAKPPEKAGKGKSRFSLLARLMKMPVDFQCVRGPKRGLPTSKLGRKTKKAY